jgi:Na+-translocating ferredoxin:NAD+ oxidoreductase subunit C
MKLSFKGGIHPLTKIHHGKYLTEKKPIEKMPVSKDIVISTAQHIGAPAKPIVKVGQKVLMGQMIGEATGFVSVPVHASVSGTVVDISERPHILGKDALSIVIENDFNDEKVESYGKPREYETMEPKEIVNLIKEGGLVGMGGATFPTHVKLSPPPDKKIDVLIVNGAECEPFLTSDHRAMLEMGEQIVKGLKIAMKILDVKDGYIGIENNKKNAIVVMEKHCKDEPITIKTLKVKYPQGGEKQLIKAITKREVPSGGLPMDIGAVVLNASTCIAMHQAVEKNMPLIERSITVTGCVKEPKNLQVRVGTKFEDIFEYCGGFSQQVEKILVGGPLMGLAQYSLETATVKGVSGLLALDEKTAAMPEQSNCIRCAKCVTACPAGLLPLYMNLYAIKADYDNTEKLNVMDCIECGACSYICPSKRYLTQSFKLAKVQIRNNKSSK